MASDTTAILLQAIIGREQVLAELSRFLSAVPSRPSALLIEGEAGIGKTTIWLAGRAVAADRGYLVLVSRASPAETRLSYMGLRDLVEPIIDEWLQFLPEPQQRALEFATLRQEPSGRSPEQRTVAVAFLTMLRLLAGSSRSWSPSTTSSGSIHHRPGCSGSPCDDLAPSRSRSWRHFGLAWSLRIRWDSRRLEHGIGSSACASALSA